MNSKKHQSLMDLELLVNGMVSTMNNANTHAKTGFKYFIEWKKGDGIIENGMGEMSRTKHYYKFMFYLTTVESTPVSENEVDGDNPTSTNGKQEKEKTRVELYGGNYPITPKTAFNTNLLLERAYKDFLLQGVMTLANMSYSMYDMEKQRIEDLKRQTSEAKEKRKEKESKSGLIL